MRSFNFLCVCVCLTGTFAQAAERPTLLKTCDPRPDILPRPFYDNHSEYRAQYNRPRFYGGWLAYEVSRTSQEAMVWQENYCAGNYAQHHMPPVCKTYNYPKPWEALNVGARPDFAPAKPKTQRILATTNQADEEASKEESSRKTENSARASDDEKSANDKSDDNPDAKTDAKQVEGEIREVVPSPSDKNSGQPTSLKPRRVTPSTSLRKAS